MNKQIEEMAKVIKSSLDGLGCGNFNFTGDEISTMFAKALYNAGYRKSTDDVIDGMNDPKAKAKRELIIAWNRRHYD